MTLLIYPIAFLVLFMYKGKLYKKGLFCDDFLPISQTKRIQGLACIGVILHHLTQEITSYGQIDKGPITILASMGILFTSVFFFFSGYGLIVSVNSKENYLNNFINHRIPLILIPFWISNTIYVVYRVVFDGHVMSVGKKLKYIFGLKLINSNGWFLIEILFLYLAFYLLFRLIPSKDIALGLLCLFTVGLIVYSKSLGRDMDMTDPNSSWFKGEWWYNSTIVFVLGLLTGRLRQRLFDFIKNHYTIMATASVFLFLLSFYFEEVIRKTYGYYNNSFTIGGLSPSTRTLLAQILANMIFISMIVLGSVKFESNSKFMAFCGSIMMELFLIHHLIMEVLSGEVIRNYFFRYFLVIALSIIAAFLLSKVDKIIIEGLEKLIGKISSRLSKKNHEPTLESLMRENRKKKNRKAVYLCAVITFSVIIILFIRNGISNAVEVKEEINMLQNASAGDEIYWGYYDTDSSPFRERLSWIVLSENKGTYTLMCKEGIDGAAYNKSHEAVSYEASTIRQKLLSDEFSDIFSSKEMDYMVANEYGDYISIPSVSEYTYLGEDKRILYSTEMAINKGVNNNERSKVHYWDYKDNKASWWWLRPDSYTEESISAPIVSVDGELIMDKKYVNKPSGAIRPVIKIRIK